METHECLWVVKEQLIDGLRILEKNKRAFQKGGFQKLDKSF